MNFNIILRASLLTLVFSSFAIISFCQNRAQIGLIYPMNNPVFDVETDFGTARSSKNLFQETYSPALQLGILTKKFGKFQMEVKLSGNATNQIYYMEGIADLNRIAPDTLFIPYEGDRLVYNTFVRQQDIRLRQFQFGYLFQYEFNNKLSLGSGLWLQHSRGDYSVYNSVADYDWDGNQYVANQYAAGNQSGPFPSVTVNMSADRLYKINRWDLMLPIQARFTLPFKSGNRLGVFAQANLGNKAQHYWIGSFWEF